MDKLDIMRIFVRMAEDGSFTGAASRKYLDAKTKTFMDYLREAVPKALAADAEALRRVASQT